jgi:hypothetical protein
MAFKLPFGFPKKSRQGFVKKGGAGAVEIKTIRIPWFSNSLSTDSCGYSALC